MSETSSRIYTGREIVRLDRARKAFADGFLGPDWLQDRGLAAVEIHDLGRVYRYTPLDGDPLGGLVETIVGEAR